MTKIAATEEQTFQVPASPEKVYAFFSQPEQVRQAMVGLEKCEFRSQNTVRWVLSEKVDQGIRFQADYVVTYEGDGAGNVRWHSIEGNMGGDGEVQIRPLVDGGTEVYYRETVEPDLPITSLMSRLLKPLVSRELRSDVNQFLERAREQLSLASKGLLTLTAEPPMDLPVRQ